MSRPQIVIGRHLHLPTQSATDMALQGEKKEWVKWPKSKKKLAEDKQKAAMFFCTNQEKVAETKKKEAQKRKRKNEIRKTKLDKERKNREMQKRKREEERRECALQMEQLEWERNENLKETDGK